MVKIPRQWQGVHQKLFAALTGKREDFFQAVSFAIGVSQGDGYNIQRLDPLVI